MKKETIVNLIKEVNSKLKNKTLSDMLINKVNEYHANDLSESKIFKNLLTDITGLNASIKSKEITDILESYSKFNVPEKMTLTNLANESGLFKLLTGVRASNSFANPVIKNAVQIVENQLSSLPEFRVLPLFIETLRPHAYDASIKAAVSEASSYLTKNACKVMLLNAIFELSQVPSKVYGTTISILEQSLLDNQISSDSLKMKLHESANMPFVKKMLNTLSMLESKSSGAFNLGTGSNNTTISALIAPSVVTNEKSIITVLNDRFVEIKSNEIKFLEPKNVFENHADFYNYVINFSQMKFTPTNEGIKTKFRNTQLEFKNEGVSVSAYINRTKVDPSAPINYSDMFLMENLDSKNKVATLFEGINYMTSLDFIKRIEYNNRACNVINIDKKLFVVENNNSGQVLEMNALQFVKYIKENYDQDTSTMFADELDQTSNEINSIDDNKRVVNDDILKLEDALKDVDTSIADTTDETIIESAMDLRFTIEKNINALREKYILLDSQKQALLEHNIVSNTKRFNMDDKIQTKDGRFGKVRGVDTSSSRYIVAFEDGKVLPVTESELI